MASSESSLESENIWVELLVEAQSSSRAKLPTNKSILVLGDNESGKTSLISRLRGATEVKSGTGLEFMYLNVKDDYRDDQTRLGVWMLDGDMDQIGLMKYALNEHTFDNVTVMLVASLSQPWNVMESLHRWTDVLESHLNRLRIEQDVLKQQRAMVLKRFQEYIPPDDVTLQSSLRRPVADGASVTDQNTILPLDDKTLTRNLGIPIVVVLTQSDLMSEVEKEYEYRNEHWDFIQMHVRLFCLQYGASLFYTSMKEDRTTELLYRYLVHSIYSLPFNSPACIVDKDAIFIPMGWDSDKKINVLREGSLCSRNLESPFNDVITKPLTKTMAHKESDMVTDEEQMFLQKIQSQLSSLPAASTVAGSGVPSISRDSPQRVVHSTSAAAAKTTVPRVSSAGTIKDPTKVGVGPTSTDTGLLANFFNSLLTKKPGSGPIPNDNTIPTAVSNSYRTALGKDTTAELSRMSQQQQQNKTSTVTTDYQNNKPAA